MEYQKTNVNAFLGLENNQRPELIKNEEASDIENLRFEKLGYLTNRNGVEGHPLYMTKNMNIADVDGVLWPIGTLGMTEYVIEKPWGIGSGYAGVAPYDDATINSFSPTSPGQNKFTDRFMVYAVRIPAKKSAAASPTTDRNNESNKDNAGFPLDPPNQYTWRYKAAYLLMPLTGPSGWRDGFAFAPNGYKLDPVSYEPVDLTLPSLYATFGSRSIMRADDKPSRLQIYAPVRWLGAHNQFSSGGVPKDLNWIEHYVSMQQYRESVVISDMTNGDMYLVDEYMEAEYQDVQKHRFTLRENSLAHFDVDDVVVDFGIGSFNEGVETAMALYKFYLPRNRYTVSNDKYSETFTGVDVSPTSDRVVSSFSNWRPLDPGKIGTFIGIESLYSKSDALLTTDLVSVSGMTFDVLTQYSYTSQSEADEYDDLTGSVTLSNPDITEDDQTSSDVYIWKDMKVKYYPCSGSTNLYGNLLTDLDRTWNKTNSAGTKIVKLTTHSGVEQQVPLGVWRYRFVWYLGNGEYSAPSSELVLPDLLFSGLTDGSITTAVPTYKRPVGVQSYDEAVSTPMDLSSASNVFFNDLPVAQGIKIFQNDGPSTPGTLTAFGSNFISVKKKIYSASHRFAAKKTNIYSSTGNWPTDAQWNTENYESQGNVAVICTAYFPNDIVPLDGYVAESAHTVYTWVGKTTVTYKPTALKLNIPIFKREGDKYTYNSLFTDHGVLRTVYQNKAKYSTSAQYDPSLMSYDIVLSGSNRFGQKSDVAEGKGEIFLNIVAFGNAFNADNNNQDDDDIYSGQQRYVYRNMTQLRGVNLESDRLTFIKSGVPAEVTSRVILSGSIEIPICDFGDIGTIRIEGQAPGPDYLAYNVKRSFINLATGWLPGIPGVTAVDLIKSNDPAYTVLNQFIKFSNLRVTVTAVGERLILHEQLSMYVPASLLFNAPHVKLVIPSNRVPRRARQLLVFRTRASHDNAWQPHDYGLVKTIDLTRDSNGVLTGSQATKIEFLDDVKSDELDYSYSIPDYDGFTKPIKSRFCLPLNERVYYANIKESYKPHTPRNAVNVINNNPADTTRNQEHSNINFGSNLDLKKLWSYKLVTDGSAATTNINKNFLYYFVAYNDQARSFSLSSFSGEIQRSTNNQKPLMFCMPSAYDTSVEHLNVYRLQLDAPGMTKIVMSTSRSAAATPGRVYYVAQGVVEYHGQVYYPNDVIQTYNGNDVGYDGSRINLFWNYFIITGAVNDTDRGWGMSYCQPVLYDVTDYFDGAAGPQYLEKIGTIKPEDEGIFYDNDLPSLGRLPLKQIFQNEDIMPAALRWSEPYQPNKIKLPSLMEVRSGDGDQITGLAMLYGNLIVLKERSIHRLAVQGSTVPVSRVDEISNNVGCIAPNTAITVNNTLYFLSWAGFYKYDNNVLSKIDGKFSEELQLRLRSAQNGVINPAIRDASCGWNPTYRELYLTIPVMSTTSNEGDFASGNTMGITITDNKSTREVRGITYAINVDTGLVTKYRYMDDSVYFTDPSTWVQQLNPAAPTQRAPRVYSRLYYTNTLGQLRSGEALPPRTFNYLNPVISQGNDASMEYLRVSFFIESPTKDANNKDKANDDFLMFSQDLLTSQYITINATKFVRVFWASKSWTAEDKSVLKRIRKVFSYIAASDDPVILRGIVHTSPEGETATVDTTWQYTYTDTRPASPRFNYSVTGEILGVPTESAGQTTSPSQNRGERHTFNVEGSGAFQMEYFGFYWKPINQYER